MPTNKILPFGTVDSANIMDDATYAASTERVNGRGSGIVPRSFFNKVPRQSNQMASALGEFILATLNEDVTDADRDVLAGQIGRAIRASLGLVTTLSATAAVTVKQSGIVLINAAGGNVVVTLPAANAAGAYAVAYDLVRTDTSGNTVTIARGAGDTVNGAAANPTIPVGGSAHCFSNASTNWLFQAIAGFYDSRALTAAGTTSQTVPTWARVMRAQVWAAGGGGGGCSAAGGARGGGGGEYREGMFGVTPNAAISCTVGAAGGNGSSAPASGGTGGSSSVGALITAVGGQGGSASGGGGATGGGTGGTGGSGGTYAEKGADSQLSFVIGGNYTVSCGGPSVGHGYGIFTLTTVGTNGNDGYAPGCGGNGAAGGVSTGGAGGTGLIILEFFP